MTHIHQTDDAIGAFFDQCALAGDMADFTQEELAKLPKLIEMWGIEAGDRILEPGCGQGRLTAWLARIVGPAGRIRAFDLSPVMIGRARQLGLPSCAEFSVESINALHDADDSFDRVICLNVFPHFSNHPRALAQIARVLKPGGHLWISHFEGRDALNRFHREASQHVAGHMLPDEQAMRGLVAAAGLEWKELVDAPEMYSLHTVKPKT